MKMNLRLSYLLIAGLLVLQACKKEDENNPADTNNNPTDQNYYFKCKIDGVDWKADKPTGVDTVDFFDNKAYEVYEGDGVTKNNMGIGLYPFDSLWALGSAYYIDNSFNSYEKKSGVGELQLSVKRDSVNKILEGTFAFSLVDDFNEDTIKITDGSFRVKY